jgi:ubiquinone/menaquinone biosynthesis C-methylase UbiE
MASPGLFTASLPELYERFLVEPLFRPFAQTLLERAALGRSERLLDVACGTGIVARIGRDHVGDRGHVVGVDASPGMLGVARAVAPSIEWREGDATRLPVGEGEVFDVVTCHQGLQFFADKPAAVREMRRVLAPGGRLAIGTWRPLDDTPLFRDLHAVAQRHAGPISDQRHSFGDASAIERLLTDAGFDGVRIETVTHTIRMSDPAMFARLNAMASVGMSAAAKTMSDDERTRVIDAVTEESMEVLQRYLVADALVFELGSNIATART